MARIIALVRGINVGGKNMLPMGELRAACAQAGMGPMQTYIQSGNLVLDGKDAATTETALEKLIKQRFGLTVPVIARTAGAWTALAAACPFSDEARDQPNHVMLMVSKAPPAADAPETLTARARDGERIARCGEALAIFYPAGAGTSRLSVSVIDKLVGSPVTARNWNTVLKLIEIAAA
jgi:uncharacterized protein (DUF1697 family)